MFEDNRIRVISDSGKMDRCIIDKNKIKKKHSPMGMEYEFTYKLHITRELYDDMKHLIPEVAQHEIDEYARKYIEEAVYGRYKAMVMSTIAELRKMIYGNRPENAPYPYVSYITQDQFMQIDQKLHDLMGKVENA